MIVQKFELGEQEIKEAISKWLEDRFGVLPAAFEVTISTRREARGMGQSEHEEIVIEVTAKRTV